MSSFEINIWDNEAIHRLHNLRKLTSFPKLGGLNAILLWFSLPEHFGRRADILTKCILCHGIARRKSTTISDAESTRTIVVCGASWLAAAHHCEFITTTTPLSGRIGVTATTTRSGGTSPTGTSINTGSGADGRVITQGAWVAWCRSCCCKRGS